MLRNYLLTNSGTAVHLMTLLSWSIKLRILFFSEVKSQSSHFCPIFLQETEEMEKMELIQLPLAPCSVSDQIHLLINSHHFYNVKEILLDIVTVSFEVEKKGSGNAWFLLFFFKKRLLLASWQQWKALPNCYVYGISRKELTGVNIFCSIDRDAAKLPIIFWKMYSLL